ncbi:hypothetical protein MKJ04_18430 [Pontibacter sp. E15-1]|uniref:hypothetical protein n=1 Tax=Pontibacter sp. E15-1 TaxID=2919918 RepID=UPI001F4F2EDF|nr:hypothetical protein [Pontibacter sp. E15-1]MCJ8166828.1 hypothetical protein [Pontibacter sp. E15-1]
MKAIHGSEMRRPNSGAPMLLLFSTLILAPSKLIAQERHFTPPALAMPLHTQKNQLHASAGVGRGSDLALSYAFSNHMAVFATGIRNSGRARRMTLLGGMLGGGPTFYEQDDWAYTGGIGYFWKPGTNSPRLFETYIGAGRFFVGNYRHAGKRGGYFSSRTKTNYSSLFWQFSNSRKMNKFEIAYGARLSYSNYDDLYFENDGGMYKPTVAKGLWGINIDPVASCSYLWHDFKLNGQAGFSLPVFEAAAEETRTEYYLGEEIVTTESAKYALGALLVRLSVQYTLNFSPRVTQ